MTARIPRPLPTTAAILLGLCAGISAHAATAEPKPLLDPQHQLERWDWWDNRDWDWYKASIPFFESPDQDIDATYYYRWELVTKHLVYASPQTGYCFTEFIDRPGWSGAYGAISCPLGHHFYELRWLKQPRIVEDYARYWFTTPGAQPRSYSNWYGDAMWATYLVNADRRFLLGVLPFMEAQVKGWTADHWDKERHMLVWNGMQDGMETNINSRQTKDWFRGAEACRPTLNSYLYGDLVAIANAAELAGDAAKATEYRLRAAELRQHVLAELWDPKRSFFFPQSARDEQKEEVVNGVKTVFTVKAGSLTYQTGRFAGDPHGRELIGYVPWQFNLPEPGKGYEAAWKGVTDPDVFAASFGLSCTERHDPLFSISPNCCVWSGNSWPYATAQTLTAMANVLNNYPQEVVTREDFYRVLSAYTRGQRKDGHPFIAEAVHPDTGSWDGHNTFNHSEHYFHSTYDDLVITGLAGLRPRPDDVVQVNPLIPDAWAWFCLDGVAYHGHRLSIVWDRDGTRYHKGAGLTIIADGQPIANRPALGRLEGKLAPGAPAEAVDRPHNFAANNDGGYFPRMRASYSDRTTPVVRANDGNYWYHAAPPNRWTTAGSPNAEDWIEADFGIERPIEQVKLFLLDDGPGSPVRAPQRVALEYWNGTAWSQVPGQRREPAEPTGHRANLIAFPTLKTSRLRAVMTAQGKAGVGLTEFEAWGHAELPLPPPTAPVDDLAFNPTGKGFPKASASFTSQFDRIEEINDGKSLMTIASRNRWTAYQSPNPSDWVQIDFGKPCAVGRVELHLWGDKGGVRAPRSCTIQYWDGTQWTEVAGLKRDPEKPLAMAVNDYAFTQVRTERIRVVFVHDLPGFTGVTELMVWEH
jgi:hypothetical protein